MNALLIFLFSIQLLVQSMPLTTSISAPAENADQMTRTTEVFYLLQAEDIASKRDGGFIGGPGGPNH